MIGVAGLSVPSRQLDDIALNKRAALRWMDIEGYGAHALAGLTELLTSGISVVVEYNSQLLARAKAWIGWRHCLAAEGCLISAAVRMR